MGDKEMYTEIRDNKRVVVSGEIETLTKLESLVLEIGYKKLGQVLYILGENIEKGVLLELYEEERIIRLGRVEYDFGKREVRLSGLIMGEASIKYMITHILEETRNEWSKRVK
jgi:hypothetical protein